MSDSEEKAYVRGAVAALRANLQRVLIDLRGYGEEVDSAPLVLSETSAALVELAGELGIVADQDLHPADLVRRISKEVL